MPLVHLVKSPVQLQQGHGVRAELGEPRSCVLELPVPVVADSLEEQSYSQLLRQNDDVDWELEAPLDHSRMCLVPGLGLP